MTYNKLVEACFFQPKHVGIQDCNQKLTLRARLGNESSQEFVIIYLSADIAGNILKASFKAYGNPYLIAGVEWVCRQMEGSHIDAHPLFDYHYLVEKLEIPKSQYPIAILIENGYRNLIKMMKKRLEEKKNE